MTKFYQYALMGTIVLAGAAGFTACSSSDDAPIDNPHYNPETNEVNASFVFNVSTGNTATTRQTAEATQATENELFRGIDNAVLFSYKQAGKDGYSLAALPTGGLMDKRYDLSEILAPNTIDKDNSHRVIETSLPLNTNTLVFYGKAIEGTASAADANRGFTAYDLYGHLDDYNPGYDTNLGTANFELGRRMTPENVGNFRRIEELLSGVLTCIMYTNLMDDRHVDIEATAHPSNDDNIPAYGFDVATTEYPELKWADYSNSDTKSPVETSHTLYPLEKKLADAYREMTTIKQSAGELRAGSGLALEMTMQDLWSVINEVRCATPLNKPETVAKYLAERVNERLQEYFTATSLPVDGTNVTGVTFRSTDHIITSFISDVWPTTAGTKPTDFDAIKNLSMSRFPQMFHIPDGSTHLAFDRDKQAFNYVWNYNTSAVGDASGFTVESYYYPAELLYFGNSPIRVSNTEHKPNTYPNGVANWDDDLQWDTADWTKNSHVTSSTQSVAMQNDVNYGTALLKTTIRYGASTLNDNNHAIQKEKDPSISDTDEPDNTINVSGTTFQLISVVISGQPKKVGWDFTRKADDNEVGYINDMAISDEAARIPAYTEGGSKSSPNYTLVFDNYKNTPTGQEKVYIALELRNNSGQDFFGLHNLIRNGSNFYLIGELDPATVSDFTWPTHHALPPYNADGSTIKEKRVFIQDFMTSADFVIGANSLKYAYLTVPDLRYSALTLGLSVDINWSTGLNFDNIILGGE
ncbi:MAG: hypothetical protein IJ635_06560 [Bacteroidaceae bacterium]|nr:hypothetical protein [Bacteroidaceae bacterium]